MKSVVSGQVNKGTNSRVYRLYCQSSDNLGHVGDVEISHDDFSHVHWNME